MPHLFYPCTKCVLVKTSYLANTLHEATIFDITDWKEALTKTGHSEQCVEHLVDSFSSIVNQHHSQSWNNIKSHQDTPKEIESSQNQVLKKLVAYSMKLSTVFTVTIPHHIRFRLNAIPSNPWRKSDSSDDEEKRTINVTPSMSDVSFELLRTHLHVPEILKRDLYKINNILKSKYTRIPFPTSFIYTPSNVNNSYTLSVTYLEWDWKDNFKVINNVVTLEDNFEPNKYE